MKILILGHKGHGKTTISRKLALSLGLNYIDTSLYIQNKVIKPYLKFAGYTKEDINNIINNKDDHRRLFYHIIAAYANPRDRLIKEVLSISDIYTGLRSNSEYEASKYLFDHIIYVRRDNMKETDKTMLINYNPYEMILFYNKENELNNNINLLKEKLK